MEEITLAEFYKLYETGNIFDVVYVKDRVVGKTTIGQATDSKLFKVVFAKVP